MCVSVWVCVGICVPRCVHTPMHGGGSQKRVMKPPGAFVEYLPCYIGAMVWVLLLITQQALLTRAIFPTPKVIPLFPKVFWCPMISDFGLFLLSYNNFTYCSRLMLGLDTVMHILLPRDKGGQWWAPQDLGGWKNFFVLYIYLIVRTPLYAFYPCHYQIQQ